MDMKPIPPQGQHLAQGHTCTWLTGFHVLFDSRAQALECLMLSTVQHLAEIEQPMRSNQASHDCPISEAETVHWPATIFTSQVTSAAMCRHRLRKLYKAEKYKGLEGSFTEESEGRGACKNVRDRNAICSQPTGLEVCWPYYTTDKLWEAGPKLNLLTSKALLAKVFSKDGRARENLDLPCGFPNSKASFYSFFLLKVKIVYSLSFFFF